MEKEFLFPNDIGQTYDREQPDAPDVPFLRPENIIVRNNTFENVEVHYSGNALDTALIISDKNKTDKNK